MTWILEGWYVVKYFGGPFRRQVRKRLIEHDNFLNSFMVKYIITQREKNTMKNYALLVTVIFLAHTSAVVIAEEYKIESNSCRLANKTSLNGQTYGTSKGMVVRGKYPVASNKSDCELICKKDLLNRVKTLPKDYLLEVECYLGKELLFQKAFKGQ